MATPARPPSASSPGAAPNSPARTPTGTVPSSLVPAPSSVAIPGHRRDRENSDSWISRARGVTAVSTLAGEGGADGGGGRGDGGARADVVLDGVEGLKAVAGDEEDGVGVGVELAGVDELLRGGDGDA